MRAKRRAIRAVLSVAGIAWCVGAATAAQIIVSTSDYETGNTAWYSTTTGEFVSNLMGHADQDVLVDTDGTSVYFLERGRSSISKFDPAALEPSKVIWQYSVGVDTNPSDIVFLDEKAYVIRFGAGSILIINQNALSHESFELGAIDISMFDTDGFPDAVYGFVAGESVYGFGTGEKRVYVVLQRLHGYAADVPGLLIAIDPETDTVIDLDPNEDGVQGRELLVKNPQSFSQLGGSFYIAGHVWGQQTEGVQTVDMGNPALPQVMIVSEAVHCIDFTDVAVMHSEWGIVTSSSWEQDGSGNWVQVGTAYWFDPATGELGETLPVPSPGGGAVFLGDIAYVGSRDANLPGIYPVDPATNSLAGEPLITDLPPTAMIALSDGAPDEDIPIALELTPAYPNPFNLSTTIGFTQALPGRIRVEVYAATGQRAAVLFDGRCQAGTHRVTWNARGQASGVYLIRVSGDGHAETAGVTLVK